MKFEIKSIVGLTIFLLLCSLSIKAQLFQTRSIIIEEYGHEYTTGVTDDGTKYIVYDKRLFTNASGTYTQTKAIYFTILENGSEICYMWKILEPSSETNTNVTLFKSKFVEIDYLQWKDYETNIIYDIDVKDELCIITAWWDNKK
jgi:hypothetical protein